MGLGMHPPVGKLSVTACSRAAGMRVLRQLESEVRTARRDDDERNRTVVQGLLQARYDKSPMTFIGMYTHAAIPNTMSTYLR